MNKQINLFLIVATFLFFGFSGFSQSKLNTNHAQQDEWLVIPGEQVGAIQKNTKRTNLSQFFNRRVTLDFTEKINGKTIYKTSIYKDTPNSLVIVWTNERMTEVDYVVLDGWIGSNWYTVDGLRVGLKVYDQLLDINQKPILFSGFYNEKNGGFVANWQEGTLSKYKDDLEVQIWYSGSCELTELNIYDFLENKEYSTESAQSKHLEIRVYKLFVSL